MHLALALLPLLLGLGSISGSRLLDLLDPVVCGLGLPLFLRRALLDRGRLGSVLGFKRATTLLARGGWLLDRLRLRLWAGLLLRLRRRLRRFLRLLLLLLLLLRLGGAFSCVVDALLELLGGFVAVVPGDWQTRLVCLQLPAVNREVILVRILPTLHID